MTYYIKCLISAMVICSLIVHLAPEGFDSLKKYLKYLCGLVMLVTLIMPILNKDINFEKTAWDIRDFLTSASDTTENNENTMKNAVITGTVREIAYSIMTYIRTEYGIDYDRISVSVITDEEEPNEPKLKEIQVFLHNTSPADREEIRHNIEEMTEITTYVFGKDLESTNEGKGR